MPTSTADAADWPPATSVASAITGRDLSVRAKGLVVIGILVIYAMAIAVFALHQKTLLLQDFQDIQQSQEIDSVLKQVDMAVFHSVMSIIPNINATDREAGMQLILMYHQRLVNKHAELTARIPQYSFSLEAVNAALAEVTGNPSRGNMDQLIRELVKTKNEITRLAEKSEKNRAQLSRDYHTKSDSVAMTALFFGTLGLTLLGTITWLFFRRLTNDLGTLQKRALDIVKGYRGEPLPILRHDEVGQLMKAVNSMASTLDKHEKELLLERQKYFHQEKMAAIGALAAGVAHEIGNPIAAISGLAQEMNERRDSRCRPGECESCRPDLIQVQTQRLAAITREISSLAAYQTTEPQLLDLNALLRSTASLLRYDKRLRQVALKLELDDQLPAIFGVADQFTQVVMNLLINSMDALEDVTDRTPVITLTTHAEAQWARLTVQDNGRGMNEKTLNRAFEAFYTTKAVGKGTGLGLSLCYSIMQKNGGSISIDSTPGVGTSVQVLFALTEAAYTEASTA